MASTERETLPFRLAARAKDPDQGPACVDLGFRLLEITLPCPGGDAEENQWLALAERTGASFLGHGPQEGDPVDLAGLERVYLPKLQMSLEAAARLGCADLTVHFWLDSRFLKTPILERKIALLARVVEVGTRVGVRVNLENLSEPWSDLGPVLAAIPGLGLTLDLGHAQLLCRENRGFEIIRRLFPRLRHLHLHDNFGGDSPKDDLHLIPGKGNAPLHDLFGLLKERGYDRTATLELAPAELAEARDWVIRAWNHRPPT